MSAPRATLTPHGGPIAARNAKQRWTRREGLLLRLEAGGQVGFGEASPLPGYSPDTLADAMEALAGLDLTGLEHALGGDLDSALAFAAGALGEAAPPSAVHALETALLDLWARRRGEPAWRALARLTGRRAAAVLPLATLVDLGAGTAAAQHEAEAKLRAGYRTLKAKVGVKLEAEAEALAALRRAHPSVALRVDANGTLDPDAGAPFLRRLQALGVELLEEPCTPASLARRPPLPVPVALDESLQGEGGEGRLSSLADAGRVQAMVLKPMALGGLRAALALTTLRPLPAIVSHLFDGPVAWAACAALALALGDVPHAAGLGRHAGLAAWPAWTGPGDRGAELRTWDTAGLGIEDATP